MEEIRAFLTMKFPNYLEHVNEVQKKMSIEKRNKGLNFYSICQGRMILREAVTLSEKRELYVMRQQLHRLYKGLESGEIGMELTDKYIDIIPTVILLRVISGIFLYGHIDKAHMDHLVTLSQRYYYQLIPHHLIPKFNFSHLAFLQSKCVPNSVPFLLQETFCLDEMFFDFSN